MCDILPAVNGEASHAHQRAVLCSLRVCTPTSVGVPRPRYSYPAVGSSGSAPLTRSYLACFVSVSDLCRRRDTTDAYSRNTDIVRLSRHGGGRAASVGVRYVPNRDKDGVCRIHARRERRDSLLEECIDGPNKAFLSKRANTPTSARRTDINPPCLTRQVKVSQRPTYRLTNDHKQPCKTNLPSR